MALIQPIIIASTGDHVATVSCAARASVLAYVRPLMAGQPVAPVWEQWLTESDGAMATTARTAGPDDLDAAARWAEGHELGHLRVEAGSSAAVAIEPMLGSDIPAVIAAAAEAGTDLARRDQAEPTARATVRVEVLAALATSEAADQAVRALWAWAVPQLIDAPEPLAEWARTGATIDLALVEDLDSVRDGVFVIRDQGTATAVAIPGRLLK